MDSKVNLSFSSDGKAYTPDNLTNQHGLFISKINVEKLLSEIMNRDVYLSLRHRNLSGERLTICAKGKDDVLLSSLKALSTGQALLFDMFSTLIRYGDASKIENSIDLSDICGIVVIDEIDLHLHADLQHKILPSLIKLFPKVQFIITTHSPLFLLGMQKEFGDSNLDVYEMPEGIPIQVEDFSEFQKAYDLMAETKTHTDELYTKIKEYSLASTKALIITEGETDWKHMKRAWNKLQSKYPDLDEYFEFLEYNSNSIEMGDSELVSTCEGIAKIKQPRPFIFISDADQPKVTKKLIEEKKTFRNWGNNVFSFRIPIPKNRELTPEICIEHYYTDAEIRTEKKINEIPRRLFMGNEFNNWGVSKLDKTCLCYSRNKCGEDKIYILDNDIRKTTDENKDGVINYALSKMDFADAILNEEDGFANISSDNFRLIFDIIKEIKQCAPLSDC